MAKKKVTISTRMADGFTMTSNIGNHTVYVDQPRELGGKDTGPNPIQYFLLSLSGCISTVARIIANQRKIELRSIELTIESELDTDALLGISDDKRSGLSEILVKADIDADLTPDQKKAFLAEVKKRCPVSDNIENCTNISLLAN